MFGGFSPAFYKAYHARVPQTEPVDEYEQRLQLYEAYHHLNHTLMFGVRSAQTPLSLSWSIVADGLLFRVRRRGATRAERKVCSAGCFAGLTTEACRRSRLLYRRACVARLEARSL